MSGFFQYVRKLLVSNHGTCGLITEIDDNKALGVDFFTSSGLPMQPPLYPNTVITNNKDENVEYHTTVAFEFEGWHIEYYEGAPQSECDWVSHMCPVEKWRYHINQWTLVLDGICPACFEEIPEEVMCVWKLKNMDRMPSEEACRDMLYNGYDWPKPCPW